MAAHSFQETTGLAILAVVVLVQLVIFPLIEIVIFPRSKDIQKLYLEKNYGIREAFDTSKLILFNLGFYNVLCGLVVVYAVRVECVDLLYALMWVFIGNGLVGLYQSLQYYFASLARAIPATLALSYIKFLPVADVKKMSMPWLIVLIPVLLHMSFFVLESLLFPRSKPVQMLFIGKAATSPVAVDAASSLLFGQGFYNLFLALGTVHGLWSQNVTEVKCFLLIMFGAAVVLFVSNPKLYGGALIQGGPAALALCTLYFY